jgi:hypothetical protein
MLLAKDIMDRARRLIQDETSVRWPLHELRLWLNDAVREIVLHKPSAYAKTIILPLDVGVHQTMPAGYVEILRVTRNLTSVTAEPHAGGRAVRTVNAQMMDWATPFWSDPKKYKFTKTVRTVSYDKEEPMAFYVFPGNDGTGIVEVLAARLPNFIDAPATLPDELDSYAVPVDAHDEYGNALVDYLLFRAYSKESQFAGSAQRAAVYYGAFAQGVGLSIKNESMIAGSPVT